jgi:hypothetical protein
MFVPKHNRPLRAQLGHRAAKQAFLKADMLLDLWLAGECEQRIFEVK